jgi:hypothetical protein
LGLSLKKAVSDKNESVFLLIRQKPVFGIYLDITKLNIIYRAPLLLEGTNMVFGEEIRFWIDNRLSGDNLSELLLKYKGSDSVGLKMKGEITELWTEWNQKVVGPTLCDDEHAYRVAGFDYHSGMLWLNKL